MKTNKKHLFGFAILAIIALSFTACSGGNTEPTAQELADAFKNEHSETLDLTSETVGLEHEASVYAAYYAYHSLGQDARDLLSEEIGLINRLIERIEELWRIENPTAWDLIQAFYNDHDYVISLFTEGFDTYEAFIYAVFLAYDELNAALIAYDELLLNAYENGQSWEIASQLSQIIQSLESLKEILDELIAAADTFKNSYTDALVLTVESVTPDDEAIVNAALAAYGALSDDEKVLLEDEKEILDNLKVRIEEIIAAYTPEQLAAIFKNSHATALVLTVADVTTDDEVIVNAALAAYNVLAQNVKDLLTDEKTLLDNLKTRINELPSFITINSATEWNNALTRIRNGISGTSSTNQKYYTLTINSSFSVYGSTATFGTVEYITVTLNGNGSITLSGSGNLLRITNNQTLIIDGGVTLIGRSNNNSLVYVDTGSELELRNGTIRDNAMYSINSGSDKYGGGVYVVGSFIMNGGYITGNTANSSTGNYGYGGGVYVDSDGSFTMNGGYIMNNSAFIGGYATRGYGYGGGVYVGREGSFTMNGGYIYNNYAYNSNGNTTLGYGFGGGVYVNSRGSFTMSGGTISNNIAGDSHCVGGYGGGVFIYNSFDSSSGIGHFIKSGGGYIGSNTAIIMSEYAVGGLGDQVCYGRLGGFATFSRDATLGETDNLSTEDEMPSSGGQTLNGWTW